MKNDSPLLSIGIIFRDDIRSIERCLKALQPLRDALPCELVMADTGSQDGSRKIAEKYADLVFDFPWVNDFAAARNAVIDRCSAAWYFYVDTDEYLKGDVAELVNFFRSDEAGAFRIASLTIRNHSNYDMDGDYSDFIAMRFGRIANGIRFVGKIHEQFKMPADGSTVKFFPGVMMDHDGYVMMGDPEKGKKKRERNVKLIRERMEKEPDNLLLRQEFLESGGYEPDYVDQIRAAIKLLREKKNSDWKTVGPSLIRFVIYEADNRKLPELDEWFQLAEEWFPDSMYTRIDVEFAGFMRSWDRHDYEDCVQRGERYLAAMKKYHAGEYLQEQASGILRMGSEVQEQKATISLANACCNTGSLERAMELLQGLEFTAMQPGNVAILLTTLHELQYKCDFDTAPLIQAVWSGISEEKPTREKADVRKNLFYQVAALTFIPENQKKEREKPDFHRQSYTLYLPLRGKCGVGTAAAILNEQEPEKIEAGLREVERWDQFPVQALAHALEHDVRFPLRDKPLNMEVMDGLISSLTGDQRRFRPFVLKAAEDIEGAGGQQLVWTRGMVMAAIRTFPWQEDKKKDTAPPAEENKEDAENKENKENRVETGMALARAFARTEKVFLPYCYAPACLNPEGLFALPPIHRFGWYCVQAFDALEGGNATEYVRLLRKGLAVCEGLKDMAEFLADHTPELQTPAPSAELQALAEQIRNVLAKFAPDDPAVAALKQSEAYRKVAYLIEGAEVPIVGGLLQ